MLRRRRFPPGGIKRYLLTSSSSSHSSLVITHFVTREEEEEGAALELVLWTDRDLYRSHSSPSLFLSQRNELLLAWPLSPCRFLFERKMSDDFGCRALPFLFNILVSFPLSLALVPPRGGGSI